MKSRQLQQDFWWVGALDPDLRIFDIVMETEFGTTYNAYILKGSEKTVLFEASKSVCYDQFVERVEEIVSLSDIDYLVVSHAEPDHSGTIERMLEKNSKLQILGSPGAMNFLKEITNMEFDGRIVKDGEEISLGDKTLRFISAPNLHWPDTILTYIPEDKILVTCDVFGCHYSDEGITVDNIKSKADYNKALEHYFDSIMSPFKQDVLNAMEKVDGLGIDIVATGHGPVLNKGIAEVFEKYREWASIKNPNEKLTVVIPYVSAYGYTAMLADAIEEGIRSVQDINVKKYDVIHEDKCMIIDELCCADGFLLGTPTMVGEALKPIWDLTSDMTARTHGGKIASAFGSFGWSGEGVPHIMQRLGQLNLELYQDGFKVRFKPNREQLKEAYEFGVGFGEAVLAGEVGQ